MADKALCSISDCNKPAKGRGWCAAHWWRWRNHGDPLGVAPKQERPANCSVSSCGSPNDKAGLCNAHYLRLYRRGSLGKTRADDGEPEAWLLRHIGFSSNACLIWPFARGRDGRGRLQSAISPQAHRAMCILVHGDPPSAEHEAAHSCGKGHEGCVSPVHLRWATPKQNTADKFAHGTQVMGSAHPFAKLTEGDVQSIRKVGTETSNREIGDKYGVDAETVRDIRRGITWKSVL